MQKKVNYSYFITAAKHLTYMAPFYLTNASISSQILCNNDVNVGWQNKMAEIERSVGSIFMPCQRPKTRKRFLSLYKSILTHHMADSC